MSSSLRLPDRAVHVFFLRELAKEKPPGKAPGCLGDLKTLQVVKDYVQPATAKSKTNFIDCLVGGQLDKYEPEWCPGGKLSKLPGCPSAVGPTSYFVSHAWSYTFSDLVSLVERHYEGLADTERGKKFVPVYYWVDILAVTQHFAGDFKDHPDSDFPGVIRASKAVLFTMYPWRSPIAPTRVWCLFEALTAVQSEGVELDVLLDTGGSKDTGVGTVLTVASSLDVRAAQASVPSDKAYIMGCIRDGVGVEAFNAILRKRLKDALLSSAVQAATRARDTEAALSLIKARQGACLWPPKAVPPSGSAIPRKLVLAGRCAGQDPGRVNTDKYGPPAYAYLPLTGKTLAAVARMLQRQEDPSGAASAGGGGGLRVSVSATGRRASTAAAAGRPAASSGVGDGGHQLLGATRSGAPSRAGSKGPTAMDLLGGSRPLSGGEGGPDSPAAGGKGGEGIEELWLRPAPVARPVSYRPFWAYEYHLTPEELELKEKRRGTLPGWDKKKAQLLKQYHFDYYQHEFQEELKFANEWETGEKAKLQAAAEAQAAKERPAKEAAERADRALLWPSLGSCSSLAVLGLYNGWMTADDVEGLGRALRSSRTVRELHLVAVRPEDGYPGGLAGLTRELLAAALGSRSLEVLVLAPPQVAFLEGLEVPAAAAWDLGGGAAIKDFTLAPVALGPRAAKQLAELLAPLPKLQGGAVGALKAKPRVALPGEDYPVAESFRIAQAETTYSPKVLGDEASDIAPVLQVLSHVSAAGPRSAALSHFIGVATGPAIVDSEYGSNSVLIGLVTQHEAAHMELLKLALQAAPQEYISAWPRLIPQHLYRLLGRQRMWAEYAEERGV
ncbi:hypothetical protein GPECTOR_227g503 [Gonium pectorale]|uniref:Uncharacterized protein n=1 Tax=Gonium pectorale TaxID=33097 RepID=A0A150FWL8_GONPE|nr:hypothetical protein GPECTOR_227g503 [Gonium pectorale]|eukprot:KXZ41996.1 hypothetical protein GPECTOR_227g503 [Gonium pectorale]